MGGPGREALPLTSRKQRLPGDYFDPPEPNTHQAALIDAAIARAEDRERLQAEHQEQEAGEMSP